MCWEVDSWSSASYVYGDEVVVKCWSVVLYLISTVHLVVLVYHFYDKDLELMVIFVIIFS